MMTIPNILTLSRIALIPLFVVLYYCQPTYTDTPIFTWKQKQNGKNLHKSFYLANE
jgi:phosphatidylglycerophosphate synthase